MRKILRTKNNMDSKTVGLILILLGLVLLWMILFLSSSKYERGPKDVQRFIMPHEPLNKGFIEKDLNDGMQQIPVKDENNSNETDDDVTAKTLAHSNSEFQSPPTDKF
jgi:hypothetical protein